MNNAGKRLPLFFGGIFCLAMGAALSVKSNMGVSPVNSLPYTISLITGAGLGLCTTLVFTGLILLQIPILRRDFKPVRFLQLVCSVSFGCFVDAASAILRLLPDPGNYAVQLLYLCASLPVCAAGIFLYMAPDVIPMPAEGVTQALAAKTGREFSRIKILFDVATVSLSALLGFLFLGGLGGVREGTVLAALGVGRCVGVIQRRFGKRLALWLHGERAGEREAA